VYGASIEETHDIDGVERGFDVVYTSRWQEMGVSKADPEWKTYFHPFRVTQALMDRVGNEGAVFMHDLPAVRNEDVDDEVLDGPRSLAWVQAQHKMFSAMSVMEWCGAGVQDED
jgi:ornithine carbamoyltransferase